MAGSARGELPVLRLTGDTTLGDHHTPAAGEKRTVWIQAHNGGMGSVLTCAP